VANNTAGATGVFASRSALGVLFSVVFLDNLGYAIVLPYLFFYVSSLGGSAFLYGVLLASYSLMSFVFTPIVARLSDRYGRRKILLVALAISSLSYFVFGVAHVLWLLFVGRMLAGTTAATVPVAQAYVADVTDHKSRLRYLGLLGAAAGIAFILGPAIGGTLSGLFGYGVPSFLASAFAFTNLVSAYFRLPEPVHPQIGSEKRPSAFSAFKSLIAKREISLLFSIYFLLFLAFIFLPTILPLWLSENFGYGPVETGLLFFYVGLVSAFTQAVLLPRLSKKASNSMLVIYGVILLAVGFFALGIYANLLLLIVIGALIPVGFGIINATMTTLISFNAPFETTGSSLGIAWSLTAVAQTIAPTLATSLFAFGISNGFNGLAFAVSGVITVAAFPLVWFFKKTVKE
jgi:MFS family permease